MPIRPTRQTLTLAGAASLGAAALSAEIAWLHMRWAAATYGVVCGQDGIGHCAACPTALGLAGLGLGLLAARLGPSRATASVRSSGTR